MRIVTLALIAGCIENNVTTKPDEPVFDPGDSATPIPDTDTDEVVDTGDSGGGTIVHDYCDSQLFGSEPLTTLDECEGGTPSTPDFDLQENWSDLTLGYMLSSPVMVNLTDDNGNGRIDDNDVPDVIAAPYTSGIYAMDGATGARLWSTASTQIEQSTPAVGDVDLDGYPDVFVQGLYGSFMLDGVTGATKWTGRAPSSIKTYCGAPGIADFEGDGSVELYFGRLILDGVTGDTLYEGSGGQGTSISGEGPISVAADIDLDGTLELVGGNTIYDNHANIICTASGPDGFPAVGNFDSDPEGEVLVSAQGRAYLYDDDCSVIWTYSISGYGGPPAIADLDGDGLSEAIVPSQSGIVVLDVDGNEVWSYNHGSGTLYDGVSAYDFDGDGDWEVVLNAPTELILFDGDGDILDEVANSGTYTCGQEPTMADIDNDGHAEIAYTHGQSGSATAGITVLSDTSGFAAALSVWNQHAYSITNIDNDGQVPTTNVANWDDDINNFRAGPPISYVFEDKNLVGKIQDVCTDDCDLDEVTVWWSVGDNGQGEVTDDFNVELWGDTDTGPVLLYTYPWTADLDPGWMSAAIETHLTGVPHPLYDITLKIDGGNSASTSEVSECNDSDNEQAWGEIVCL